MQSTPFPIAFCFIHKAKIKQRLPQGIQRACSQIHVCINVIGINWSQKIADVLLVAFFTEKCPTKQEGRANPPQPSFTAFCKGDSSLLKPNAPLYEKEVCEEELYRMQPPFN